jgi:hypothetical protein
MCYPGTVKAPNPHTSPIRRAEQTGGKTVANPETYRYKKLIKAVKQIGPDGIQKRYVNLRSDGMVLRRDATRNNGTWKSPGWRLFARKAEAVPWPEYAHDFVRRLRANGYRVTWTAPVSDLVAHGFSAQLRRDLATLGGPAATTSNDIEADGNVLVEVKPREKSRYRLWVCSKCGQKVRAATDQLRVMCVPCKRAFVRMD